MSMSCTPWENIISFFVNNSNSNKCAFRNSCWGRGWKWSRTWCLLLCWSSTESPNCWICCWRTRSVIICLKTQGLEKFISFLPSFKLIFKFDLPVRLPPPTFSSINRYKSRSISHPKTSWIVQQNCWTKFKSRLRFEFWPPQGIGCSW